MGRVIQGTQQGKTPIVRLKEKAGSTFIGDKLRQKPGKQEGSFIFDFAILDGDATTALPTGKKIIKDEKAVNEYAPVDVKVGDTVAIFGDTQLNDKLAQVEVGERVKITYNGLKLNEKSGRAFNDYTVEVL